MNFCQGHLDKNSTNFLTFVLPLISSNSIQSTRYFHNANSNKDKNFHGTWLIPTSSIVGRLWKLEFYSWRKRATQFYPYECNSDIREQLYSFISTFVVHRLLYIVLLKILISLLTHILYAFQLLTLYLTSTIVLQFTTKTVIKDAFESLSNQQGIKDQRARVHSFEKKKRKFNPKTCHRLYNRVSGRRVKSLFSRVTMKTTRKSLSKNQQTN